MLQAAGTQRQARLPNRPKRSRTLISLTPLIDVVFILLVFFMLASSFLDWRSIEMNTPGDLTAGAIGEGAILVEVRPDSLRLAGEIMSVERLMDRVLTLLSRKPDRRVVIKPAQGVTLQETVVVLDRLSTAGIGNLSLVRDPAR